MYRIASVVLIALLLCGCASSEYPFKNANDAIVGVELLYNPHADEIYSGKPFELICVLDEISAKAFMEEVVVLETNVWRTAPPRNYGQYIARVTYDDGDVELFGSKHIEFVEKGSTPIGVGVYSFSGEAFEEVFLKYSNKDSSMPVSTETTQ